MRRGQGGISTAGCAAGFGSARYRPVGSLGRSGCGQFLRADVHRADALIADHAPILLAKHRIRDDCGRSDAGIKSPIGEDWWRACAWRPCFPGAANKKARLACNYTSLAINLLPKRLAAYLRRRPSTTAPITMKAIVLGSGTASAKVVATRRPPMSAPSWPVPAFENCDRITIPSAVGSATAFMPFQV